MIRRTHNFLQWAFAIFVLYLLLTRLFISWVQFFPANFISTVSSVSGASIQVENIEVSQDWLGFQLKVDGLAVNSDQFVLQAEQLELDFNTFYFVLPSIDYGDYLQIRNGAYQVKSVHKIDLQEAKLPPLSELLTVDVDIQRLWKRVMLTDFVISEIQPGLSVQLHDFQSLKGTRLTLVSEFSLSYKDVLDYERFNFKTSFTPNVWGEIDNGDFSLSSFKPLRVQRIAKLLPAKWQEVLPRGELIVDLKGKVVNSQLAQMNLQFNSQSLNWKQSAEGLPESVGLNLEWKQEQQNISRQLTDWQFSLSKIQIDNRFIESVSPVQMFFEGDEYLHFSAERFDIEPFKVIVKALVDTDFVSDIFDRAVTLNISNFSGKLDWQTLAVPDLNIHFGRLDLPVTDYPGMSLRSFSLLKTPDKITVSSAKPVWILVPQIHPKPMRVDLPKLFALDFDSINKTWRLPKLDFSVNQMPISIEMNQVDKSYVDARFNAKVESMVKLKSYLPYSFMSKPLQSWLTDSLKEGRDIDISGEIRGLLANFPFTDQDGKFEVKAHVKDAVLKYNANWPELTDFDADIYFSPYQIDISVPEVQVGANNLARDVKVVIPDLNQPDIGLSVSGKVDTSFKKAADYLTLSPLAEKIGIKSFLKSKSSSFSGKALINIEQIWVPISGYKNESEKVKGSVVLNNAGLEVFEQLTFNRINGRLNFSESAMSASNIQYGVLKGSGKLNVVTDKKNKRVLLNAQGQAFIDKNDWFVKPLPWNSTLNIPFKSSKHKGITLNADFDLENAESKMPAPLGREDLVGKKLELKTTIEDESILTSIDIQDRIKTQINWLEKEKQLQLDSMKVLLGRSASKTQLLKNKGSFVSGNVGDLNLKEWFKVFKTMPSLSEEGEASKIQWRKSQILFKRLNYLSTHYDDVKVSWETIQNEPLAIQVSGKSLSGRVVLKEADEVDVLVDRFRVKTGEALNTIVAESQVQKECVSQVADNLLPKINFSGKDIIIDGRKINALKFTISDQQDRMLVKPIAGSFGDGAGVLNGEYLFNKNEFVSLFNVGLKSKKVSEITKFLKVEQGLSGKQAEVNLNLNWQGGLDCFSIRTAKGDLDFELLDGSIEEVEPGVARLIGLLSVESLVRRLQLNLNDVTNKGMAYDSIQGEAKIDKGLVNLTKFKIAAPSVTGEIKGGLDINNQTFNLKAKITPKIGATIPTIAALAGSTNPLAALAVYTLMKAIPDVNENLITYEYRVTGPWADPNIEQKNKPEQDSSPQSESILDLQ